MSLETNINDHANTKHIVLLDEEKDILNSTGYLTSNGLK
jgi:hypothetical protein